MQKFQQLDIWKKAHLLVLHIYRVSANLPPSENLGLVFNLRRSAIQIAKSISEGAGKDSDAEFAADLKRHGRLAMSWSIWSCFAAIWAFLPPKFTTG